ncbi:nuclear transport factor 2 family protein [Geodermatophilus sp. SYSU D00691]
MSRADSHPPVLERLLGAVEARDLDALVSCFAVRYVNETPAHPQRGFRGNDQVRRNWAQIFAIADFRAEVPRYSLDRDRLWTEWEMSGTRPDGAPFLMRGVVIFVLDGDTIRSARFYLEPVEHTSGDVDVHTRRVVGAPGDRTRARQQ